MKFPNIKVQPHWLAALQRALAVMPHCPWVCAAVSRGIEPEIEKDICDAIRAAIYPWDFVSNWHFHETDTQLPNLTDYRIAWITHMIEQCRAKHKEEEPDDECPHCAGTGEGQYDGQSCSVCRGKGFIRK